MGKKANFIVQSYVSRQTMNMAKKSQDHLRLVVPERKLAILSGLLEGCSARSISRMTVLTIQGNVSKGIVTTTSDFAPSIFEETGYLMPHRLELKNGTQLLGWLLGLPGKD